MKRVVLIVTCLLLSFLLGVFVGRHKIVQTKLIVNDTTIVDTIKVIQPIPIDSAVVRYINVKVPLYDTIWTDTLVTDSIDAVIPITSHHYSADNYDAWVSGYNANLDSIYTYEKTEYIDRILQETIYKKKKWGVGVQIGIGINKEIKPTPYVGVGVTYNIF